MSSVWTDEEAEEEPLLEIPDDDSPDEEECFNLKKAHKYVKRAEKSYKELLKGHDDALQSRDWKKMQTYGAQKRTLGIEMEYLQKYIHFKRFCAKKEANRSSYMHGVAELWGHIDWFQSTEGDSYSVKNLQEGTLMPKQMVEEMRARMYEMVVKVQAPSDIEAYQGSDCLSIVLAGGDIFDTVQYVPDMLVSELKVLLADMAGTLHLQRESVPEFHVLMHQGALVPDDVKIEDVEGLEVGSEMTLMLKYFCEKCLGECKCETCHHYRNGRQTQRHQYFRVGTHKDYKACEVCGYCKFCLSQCKCTLCHGQGSSKRGGCEQCGIYYDPCWGGSTRVLLPEGGTKNVRDVRVGDALRTVKGVRRVSAIWSGPHSRNRTEVCKFRGVWITSHHPVIVGQRWVFPADVCTSYKLEEKKAEVGELFNFELEGHDDTLLVKGETSEDIIVTCTIGKYLGERYGANVCTRRSTRCVGNCAQCDAVYLPGIDFAQIDPSIRWRTFDPFPCVEWDGAEKSEFEWAAGVMKSNAPSTTPVSNEPLPPEPAWRQAILADLDARVASAQHRITAEGLRQLLTAHKTFNVAEPHHDVAGIADFGKECLSSAPVPSKHGECGMCGGVGEVLQICDGCEGWCCRTCLLRAARNPMSRYPYALPLMPCPWCDRRVPVAKWKSIGVQPGTAKAAALLTAACQHCTTTSSSFVPQDSVLVEPADRQRSAAKLFDDEPGALEVWRRYSVASIGPKEALEQLRSTLVAKAEGKQQNVCLREMLLLVEDEERRMGLQLAALEADASSACSQCGRSVCLRCHTDAHGGECPVQERCDASCPTCAVGANPPKDHNMLLCVCGKYWEHDGAKSGVFGFQNFLANFTRPNCRKEARPNATSSKQPIKWDVERMRTLAALTRNAMSLA